MDKVYLVVRKWKTEPLEESLKGIRKLEGIRISRESAEALATEVEEAYHEEFTGHRTYGMPMLVEWKVLEFPVLT